MLFNTIDFVIFFIIVLTAIVLVKRAKYQHIILLVASYFFFYYSSNYLIILLIVSTLVDYYIAKEIWQTIDKSRKKLLLTVSLGINLGLLGFYKYANFAIAQFNFFGEYYNLNETFPLLDIVLPIGISFYTFQTISYTVDVYRGELEPSKNIKEFALFVSFFPQLVAGPIVRAKTFLPQLRQKIESIQGSKLRQIIIHNSNLKFGITLIAFGFFKKMFFADNVAPLVNTIFESPIGAESFTIILGAIAFGIQIYGDFSGYSDIAIGTAMVFGFKIPKNFNKPYFATSPADFWHRWHISLSTWLRDYLYIPLGGNKKSRGRTYFNLMTVMFLGGLWHGASWNFVIWGVLHGLYLAIHKVVLDCFPFLKNSWFFNTKIGKIISISITQYLVFLTWIVFRVRNPDDLIYSLQKYIILDFEIAQTLQVILQNRFEIVVIILFLIVHFISFKKSNLLEKVSSLKLTYWIMFLVGVMSIILFFYSGNPEGFIYFQF